MITSFQLSLNKLDTHLKKHQAYDYYKAARIFYPQQLPCLTHDIEEYGRGMTALSNPSVELMEEWLFYTKYRQDSLPNLVQLPSFWGSMRGRFPLLSHIASDAIWMPVTSVDVERSFSQYKTFTQ